MKQVFHKKMPFWLDIKIRVRLVFACVVRMQKRFAFLGGLLLVPAIASLVLLIQTDSASIPTAGDTARLVATIRAAQIDEIEKAAGGIYHMKRIIEEGVHKADFVTHTTGEKIITQPRRDIVETWQHNDTALALIESNQTERSFEVFLSLEHDGVLALHHYGPKDEERTSQRVVYDAAHDLSSLYASYSSLERPVVPVLPVSAELVAIDQENNEARFSYSPTEGLEIIAIIDLVTKLMTEELVYVEIEEDRFEMTRIRYSDRSVIPAEEFGSVFDPKKYAYVQVL